MASENNQGNKDENTETDADVPDLRDRFWENVNQFIDGIYRELNINRPDSFNKSTTQPSSRRSLDLNSSSVSNASYRENAVSESSPDTLRNADSQIERSRTSSFSFESSPRRSPSLNSSSTSHAASQSLPETPRNMDSQIEKINQMCSQVHKNLRSVGLDMQNGLNSNSTPQEITDTELSSSNSPPKGSSNSPPSTSANCAKNLISRKSVSIRPEILEVIDLSNSLTEVSNCVPIPLRDTPGDDDDVIVVSAHIPEIVDLSTPRCRVNNDRRIRLSPYPNSINICKGPSLPRRRLLLNSASDDEKLSNTSTKGNSDGRTKIICPICMDSCVDRAPSTTTCGHIFCKVCIQKAIFTTKKCPVCNTKMKEKNIFRIFL